MQLILYHLLRERKRVRDWTTLLIAVGGWLVTLAGYIIVDRREKRKQMDGFKDEIVSTLNNHREEYLKGIESVKDDITNLRAEYQQSQAIIGLKIDALEKKQDAHNSVVTRVFQLEASQRLQEEQIKVANHRIEDLEKK